VQTGTTFRPRDRRRPVSAALQVYAAMATSASLGAARDISLLGAAGDSAVGDSGARDRAAGGSARLAP
jgi:hypothetical protein